MATLKVSHSEAQDLLGRHIDDGEKVLKRAEDIQGQAAYEEWDEALTRWIKIAGAAVRHVYDAKAGADFENTATPSSFVIGSGWGDDLRGDYKAAKRGVNELRSLVEQLPYANSVAASGGPEQATVPAQSAGPPVIFLVHGHAHGVRAEVARFLERAGDHQYEVVILDEKASRGRTLVEKLEQHASPSQYAVVLLTGDDEGGPKAKPDERNARARQNVVFELGWFCGQIGRENVTVLVESGIEKPSDIDGLVYVALDDDWEKLVVRELCDAGFDFDTDRA